MFFAMFAILGGIVSSCVYAWPITLLMIFSIPIFGFFQIMLFKIEFEIKSAGTVNLYANATQFATEAVINIRTVRSFNSERFMV